MIKVKFKRLYWPGQIATLRDSRKTENVDIIQYNSSGKTFTMNTEHTMLSLEVEGKGSESCPVEGWYQPFKFW